MPSFFRSLSQRFRSSNNNNNGQSASKQQKSNASANFHSNHNKAPSSFTVASGKDALGNMASIAENPVAGKDVGTASFDTKRECQCKILLLDGTYMSVVVPVGLFLTFITLVFENFFLFKCLVKYGTFSALKLSILFICIECFKNFGFDFNLYFI